MEAQLGIFIKFGGFGTPLFMNMGLAALITLRT